MTPERARVGQLAAKIQTAEEAEHFPQRRALAAANSLGEVERRDWIEQQLRSRSITSRRRQKKNLIHTTDYDT
jgi:hypothetical protein